MFAVSRAGRWPRYLAPISLAIVLGLISSFASVGLAAHPAAGGGYFVADSTPPVAISSFSLQPQSVSAGGSLTVSVSLSGGTAPYYLWFNGTVPGCQPSGSPVSSGGLQYQFSCQPSAQGDYTIHLDVVDSSTPSTRASSSADLTVVSSNNGNNNNNNNNNGNGSGGAGSLALPSGLEQLVLIIALVFVGTMVAIAAGTIATAAMVSRRLRQINETLAKMGLPPRDPKPPA